MGSMSFGLPEYLPFGQLLLDDSCMRAVYANLHEEEKRQQAAVKRRKPKCTPKARPSSSLSPSPSHNPTKGGSPKTMSKMQTLFPIEEVAEESLIVPEFPSRIEVPQPSNPS